MSEEEDAQRIERFQKGLEKLLQDWWASDERWLMNWILITDQSMPNGERGLESFSSEDLRSWEAAGFLRFEVVNVDRQLQVDGGTLDNPLAGDDNG